MAARLSTTINPSIFRSKVFTALTNGSADSGGAGSVTAGSSRAAVGTSCSSAMDACNSSIHCTSASSSAPSGFASASATSVAASASAALAAACAASNWRIASYCAVTEALRTTTPVPSNLSFATFSARAMALSISSSAFLAFSSAFLAASNAASTCACARAPSTFACRSAAIRAACASATAICSAAVDAIFAASTASLSATTLASRATVSSVANITTSPADPFTPAADLFTIVASTVDSCDINLVFAVVVTSSSALFMSIFAASWTCCIHSLFGAEERKATTMRARNCVTAAVTPIPIKASHGSKSIGSTSMRSATSTDVLAQSTDPVSKLAAPRGAQSSIWNEHMPVMA